MKEREKPKPLSKQRMGEIATYIQYRLHDTGVMSAEYDQMLAEQEELLSDATFWRDAVKNTEEWFVDGHRWKCNFCAAHFYRPLMSGLLHKPDCPWLLAQDGE